jgi:PilZ domain
VYTTDRKTQVAATTSPLQRRDDVEQFASQLADLSRKQAAYDRDESRQEPRYPTNDPAIMQVLCPKPQCYLDVQILDVSKQGMKLELTKFLNPGTIVQVRLDKTCILGEVRYCVQVKDVFYAGILIENAA